MDDCTTTSIFSSNYLSSPLEMRNKRGRQASICIRNISAFNLKIDSIDKPTWKKTFFQQEEIDEVQFSRTRSIGRSIDWRDSIIRRTRTVISSRRQQQVSDLSVVKISGDLIRSSERLSQNRACYWFKSTTTTTLPAS